MSDSLRGRSGLVTGAGSGLGRATALQFGAVGARVVVADVNLDAGEAVVAEIVDSGGSAIFVATDVTDPAACEALVAACVDGFGGLDFAVNNAGTTGTPGSVVDYPLDAWRATMAVNLDGVDRKAHV